MSPLRQPILINETASVEEEMMEYTLAADPLSGCRKYRRLLLREPYLKRTARPSRVTDSRAYQYGSVFSVARWMLPGLLRLQDFARVRGRCSGLKSAPILPR